MSSAKENREWVRNKIAERGWTKEIEEEAKAVLELRLELEEDE